MRTNNRWVIAIAGVFFQIALGAVYAWSVFRVPLTKQFGWTISEVTLTFTISIFVLGFAAFFGGLWLNRKGPRVVALTGGALYGLGVFLASFSHDLWWLYLSYGVIGGIGLGLGYIVPVVVGALAVFVSQYLRRHFDHFTGGTAFSGTDRSNSGSRSEHGRTG